ncbi:MAG TPA: outer membrane beta-barrel protein [Opitutaceae bacterium]|nr:outer membrane beta-barrel protein [Opitutaceae bacterium]
MKKYQSLKLCLCLSVLPLAAMAQTTMTSPSTNSFGTTAGTHELMFGAVGVSNKEMDDSFGGLNVSFGDYLNDTLELSLRQSVNYSNPANASSAWNGSTRLALDQHFSSSGAVRPFLGVNFGGIYGDQVRDTFAAGIEGGAKFYIHPRTFVFAMAEYAWSFRHARAINDRFDDGQFNWNAGVGFNF